MEIPIWNSKTVHSNVFFVLKIGIADGSTSSISIYVKVIAKIEHFSELFHFILMRITLAVFIVPSVTTTYFKYYILGWGDASFQDFPNLYEMGSFFMFLLPV